MSSKGHISSRIANREEGLYGKLKTEAEAFTEYLVDCILTICNDMMYDFHDRFLHVNFDISFANAKKGKAEVQVSYYINRTICDSTAIHNLNEPHYSVARDVIEYFDTRIMSIDQIRRDFISKKMSAYKAEVSKDENEGHIMHYQIHFIYLLGAQKNKPTAV